jgi:hypothetical protein
MKVINNLIEFSNENFSAFKAEITNIFDSGIKEKVLKENDFSQN